MNYEKVFTAEKGVFYDTAHYDTIISDNSHGVYEDGTTLFRFVKGAISEEKRDIYKKIIKPVAKSKTKNRGTAAGPCLLSKFPPKAVALCKRDGTEYTDGKDRYSVHYKEASGKIMGRCQSNMIRSGVAGYFDSVAGLPCRKVGWSRDNLSKHEILEALARDITHIHKTTEPASYEYHRNQADLSPSYLFTDSIYSTMTLNMDFRTACHKDTGDLEGGLSTLTIFEELKENYKGLYLGLPEYKIAFDLRDGDMLLFNAHEFHANTEAEVLTARLPLDDLTKKPYCGRLSVVCYLRNKLKNCPTS